MSKILVCTFYHLYFCGYYMDSEIVEGKLLAYHQFFGIDRHCAIVFDGILALALCMHHSEHKKPTFIGKLFI
jgi:hypothetical protein